MGPARSSQRAQISSWTWESLRHGSESRPPPGGSVPAGLLKPGVSVTRKQRLQRLAEAGQTGEGELPTGGGQECWRPRRG